MWVDGSGGVPSHLPNTLRYAPRFEGHLEAVGVFSRPRQRLPLLLLLTVPIVECEGLFHLPSVAVAALHGAGCVGFSGGLRGLTEE